MLKGKNAIITGARSGIGLATLRLFAQNGCNIWAVVHRDDEQFLSVVADVERECGVWVKVVNIDLGQSESIKAGMKQISQEKLPIDILVNAAGVVSPARMFVMTRMEDVRRVMEVNYFAVVQMCQYAANRMIRQRSGSIINIASVSAWGTDTSQMEYAASKAAIVVMTQKLAGELGAYGIRVNAVAPGLTQTKMLDEMNTDALGSLLDGVALHRMGKPEEIAEACLFLAGDAASFVTGQTIKVDGGVI